MVPHATTRLPWVDHLRTFVIVLVVNMHACVTYSHVGDWYYMSDHEPSFAAKFPFILWQAHLQSFFMGLLFFVAGYFAYGSLVRRGFSSFVRERLFRLGVPTLFYMLVIHPFIILGLNPWHNEYDSVTAVYAKYIRTGHFLGSSGPLWFAFALLIFCLIFALSRAAWPSVTPATGDPVSAPPSPPSATKFWLGATAIGVISFAVRLVQPLGTNVLNLQLCFFSQYIAFFAAGLAASRRGWLVALAASPHARTAGWLALIGGPVALSVLLITGVRHGGSFFGGWHWEAFGLAVWEQLVGTGLSLGLLAFFSRRLNRENAGLRWLSDRAFGVYVLHAPVLVGLAMVYRTLPQSPMVLAALLTLTGLVLSFILSDAVRRIPGIRTIL